jgi:hypothetical protein
MAPARKRAASPPVGMPTKRDDFGAPIDAYVDAVPSEQRPSFDRLRTIIEATVPDAQASLKWGTPCFSVDGKLLCAVAALTHHVVLRIWAPPDVLDDPAGRLEGSSPKYRVLKVRNVHEIDSTPVRRWLRAAVASSG